MSTDFTSKNIEKLDCELCDFKCCKKGDYNRHVLTSKHKKHIKGDIMETTGDKNMPKISQSNLTCEKCNKEYTSKNGLWKHKQKCGNNSCKSDFITCINDSTGFRDVRTSI